jgi:hypothetical protein
MIKWMYKANVGVLAVDGQIEALKDYFDQDKAEDPKQFRHITYHQAISMIGEAKESVKEDVTEEVTEIIEDEKPKEIIDCSKWIRQKCDSFLKENNQPIPEETGVEAGRKAVNEFLNG